MSKPQIPALIRLEDYPKELRDAMETLAKSVNPFMEDTYRQLNGQIGFENLTRLLASVDVKTDGSGGVLNEPQVRIGSLRSKIVGVAVIAARNLDNTSAYPTGAPFLSWDVTNSGTILIKNITGLAANSQYRLTLEIIGN